MTSWAVDGSLAPIRVFINGNEIGRAKSVEVEAHADEGEIKDYGYVSARSVLSSFEVNLDMEGVAVDVRPVSPPGAVSGVRPAIVIADELAEADAKHEIAVAGPGFVKRERDFEILLEDVDDVGAMSAPPTPTYDFDGIDTYPSTTTIPKVSAPRGGVTFPTVSTATGGTSTGAFGSWFGPSGAGVSSGSLWHAADPDEPESIGDLMSELVIDQARLVWIDDPGEWQLELALRHIDNGSIATITVPFNTPLVINDLIDALETYAEETE